MKQTHPMEGAVSPFVEYHADDYGLFPAQSRRILNCFENGALNAVSSMPNSPHLAPCMALLPKGIPAAVHLNLMEGRPLSPPEAVSLLTGPGGAFHVTFGSLLLRSYLPGRGTWRTQLKHELRAQLRAVAACRRERPCGSTATPITTCCPSYSTR